MCGERARSHVLAGREAAAGHNVSIETRATCQHGPPSRERAAHHRHIHAVATGNRRASPLPARGPSEPASAQSLSSPLTALPSWLLGEVTPHISATSGSSCGGKRRRRRSSRRRGLIRAQDLPHPPTSTTMTRELGAAPLGKRKEEKKTSLSLRLSEGVKCRKHLGEGSPSKSVNIFNLSLLYVASRRSQNAD